MARKRPSDARSDVPDRSRANTVIGIVARGGKPAPSVIWSRYSQNSRAGKPINIPLYPRAVTPMISNGAPSMFTVVPTTEGLAPKSWTHSSYANTATLDVPARSSSAAKTRPTAAPTPRVGKQLPVYASVLIGAKRPLISTVALTALAPHMPSRHAAGRSDRLRHRRCPPVGHQLRRSKAGRAATAAAQPSDEGRGRRRG